MFVPTIVGMLAGIISSPYFLSQPIYVAGALTNPLAVNHSSFAFLILAIFIYLQKYIFPLIGIKSSGFGFKDWFFLSFMTFCFWYISWTILLNGPAPVFGPFF